MQSLGLACFSTCYIFFYLPPFPKIVYIHILMHTPLLELLMCYPLYPLFVSYMLSFPPFYRGRAHIQGYTPLHWWKEEKEKK